MGGRGLQRRRPPYRYRLIHDGESVWDVPAKLSARVRVFAAGNGCKTDPIDAHSVALAALRTPNLVRLQADPELVVMGMLVDRARRRHKRPRGGGNAVPLSQAVAPAFVIETPNVRVDRRSPLFRGDAAVLTGVRMPWMNSITERWVKTLRAELLDRTLIWNQPRLRHALREYERHYNKHRPQPRDRLGGVVHE